jgi:hypothetical protein
MRQLLRTSSQQGTIDPFSPASHLQATYARAALADCDINVTAASRVRSLSGNHCGLGCRSFVRHSSSAFSACSCSQLLRVGTAVRMSGKWMNIAAPPVPPPPLIYLSNHLYISGRRPAPPSYNKIRESKSSD